MTQNWRSLSQSCDMFNFIYFVFLKVNQLFSAVVLSKYFEDSYLFDKLTPISSWFQSTRFPYVSLMQLDYFWLQMLWKKGWRRLKFYTRDRRSLNSEQFLFCGIALTHRGLQWNLYSKLIVTNSYYRSFLLCGLAISGLFQKRADLLIGGSKRLHFFGDRAQDLEDIFYHRPDKIHL